MSEQCRYESDGRHEVRLLQAEIRGLRTDVDCALADSQQLRRDLADLQRVVGMLRGRVDSAEMARA